MKKTTPVIERTLFVESEEAKNKIEARIKDGIKILEFGLLKYENIDSATRQYQKWNSYNETLLKSIVSDDIYSDYDSGIYIGSIDMSGYEDPYQIMDEFKNKVEEKIHGLETIIGKLDLLKIVGSSNPVKSGKALYVSRERIVSLRTITKFDGSKIARLCEELNLAHQHSSVYSIAFILRAIIDHVPPVFSQSNFDGVAGQYGNKVFKEAASSLNEFCRKIADDFLHSQIKAKENNPTFVRVDFSNELDVLLGEVIKLS